jgi:opacity protein-like surface antigen
LNADIGGNRGTNRLDWAFHPFGSRSLDRDSSVSVSRTLTQDSKSTTAFPVPGVSVALHPNPRVTLNGFVRYIKATLGDTTEGSSEANAGVEVKVWRNVAAGVSYYYNHVSEERTSDQFTGRVRYTFKGPQIYAVFGF